MNDSKNSPVSLSRSIIVYSPKHLTLVEKKRSKVGKAFSVFIILLTLLWLTPIIFNYLVDPFNFNDFYDWGTSKRKISEKAHYPLWKILNYPKQQVNSIILGDSRALALKDKYWRQLNMPEVYNFAYGGATLFEIAETFEYLKKNKKIKNLIVGIQLRSFSSTFKKGMNRVPEAIRLASDPKAYYINSFITQISWKHFKSKSNLEDFSQINFSPFSKVHAAEFNFDQEQALEQLLNPIYCSVCALPELLYSSPYPSHSQLANLGQDNGLWYATDLGFWRDIWPKIDLQRKLPPSFEKQIKKNAKSDWASFHSSSLFWEMLEQMSLWCKNNHIQLIFFIPPTIIEMQQQIGYYGFARENQQLRERLLKLGKLIDFDFNSPLTRNIANFNDAYHFNYQTAKKIIGELGVLVAAEDAAMTLINKRRNSIVCPYTKSRTKLTKTLGAITMRQGISCRVWSVSNE